MNNQISKQELEEIETMRKSNQDKRIEKKLRILTLRYQGKSNAKIAEITGYSASRVSHLYAEYKKYGLQNYISNKYKANHRSLSEEQEDTILKEFEEKANKGQIITVKEIKQRFDQEIGKDTGRGYIYMLLKRKGYRKVMPRSKHPKKANEEGIKASKKLTTEQKN